MSWIHRTACPQALDYKKHMEYDIAVQVAGRSCLLKEALNILLSIIAVPYQKKGILMFGAHPLAMKM